ncbi:hypothetical protein GCM10007973_24170 [Polymorphobacter multimanifer]|uniref:Coenzyme F420 hydrogenase/dehydrogenase, beta subunit C-terminal domain n=1 Tax=Polymorphobacter multimanifer TaxID=1070431 RepID=UPI00166F1B2F|nr:Coenzyme F420 hydrogenase/dehydrogenase, beta subunit C-terminal domain [Polymorphobacter multimanifer]GGI86914.1 hypothetical protein GCM10007973_24170 [Polymorphobacter multimanifer]
MSKALARVSRADSCSGCGLCAALAPQAITMAMQPPGYLRPQQHAPISAQTDTAIADACPGLIVDPTPAAPVEDALWGPAIEVATGYATDDTLRYRASSGGAISALLIHAMDSGLVDFVVQTGADPAHPLANETRATTDAAEVADAAGSRYTASAPLERIEEWLARPGRFAFVGKPCDVAALRARARTDPRVAEKVPLMLAFFCAGIPSAAGTRRILKRLGVEENDVATFRYRGDGWPGYATATRQDGSSERMSYADSWGQILSKEVQFRCKICPDAVGGHADIAAADAWYGDERGYPSFEEQEGRSLIMARTPAGAAILDAARMAGSIKSTPLAITEIIRMQPHQARRKRQLLARLAAMAAVGRPRPRFAGNHLAEAARGEPLPSQIKAFAGLVRRFLQGRA